MNTNSKEFAEAAGHEAPSVNVRAIWLAGVALVVTIVVSLVLMDLLMSYLSAGAEPPKEAMAPVAMPLAGTAPPLNPDQSAELQALRVKESAWLHQYAWIDEPAGVARIPIDRAMEIISQSGLPPTTGPSNSESHSNE